LHDKLLLRWHTLALGWSFIPLIVGTVMLLVATFDTSLAARVSEQRYVGFLRLGQDGEINWLIGIFAAAAFLEAIKSGWRWADMVAVKSDADGLHFHRSVGRKRLPWPEVDSISFEPRRATGRLRIRTVDGKSILVRQIDPAQGPSFARSVTERWLAKPGG